MSKVTQLGADLKLEPRSVGCPAQSSTVLLPGNGLGSEIVSGENIEKAKACRWLEMQRVNSASQSLRDGWPDEAGQGLQRMRI